MKSRQRQDGTPREKGEERPGRDERGARGVESVRVGGRSGRGTPRQDGFTLAALVVTMALMAVFLTVAVETVTFQQRREKEAELIFRGTQIVEGIRLFRTRFGRFPIKLEELAKAKPRVLRQVWNDPMSGKPDWDAVFLGEEGTVPTPTPNPNATPQPTPVGRGGKGAVGAIVGVKSSHCKESIRVYLGHTNYCDWKFFYDPSKPMGSTPVVAVPTPKP